VHTWTVDAAPDAAAVSAIHTGPTRVSASTSATFTFAAPHAEGVKLCQLDGGAYSQCHSPMTYTGACARVYTLRPTESPPVRRQRCGVWKRLLASRAAVRDHTNAALRLASPDWRWKRLCCGYQLEKSSHVLLFTRRTHP
jgi:hypothetical protein